MKECEIYRYTRKDALEDGVLICISDMAEEAGIKYPIAVTAELWHCYIQPCEEMKSMGQSQEGRLWDLLTLLVFEISKSKDTDTTKFSVLFQMEVGKPPELINLKAVCHPGDNLEPVITIMMPGED